MLLWLLKTANVVLELQLCAFFTYRIDHVGHINPYGRLEIASHTTSAI